MRLAALIAATGFLAATPASAEIIELHLGQVELDPDTVGTVADNSGRTYRLSAVNRVESSTWLRLELRRDDGEVESAAGSFDASRDLLRLGVFERWGGTAFSYGFEIGAAKLKGDNSLGVSESETGVYLGMDIAGRLGGFEWQVDATGFDKAPQLLEPAGAGDYVDRETWYGAQIAWNFESGPAAGFRMERAGDFETAGLFVRWSY